jgi:Tol biopolymer transport system component
MGLGTIDRRFQSCLSENRAGRHWVQRRAVRGMSVRCVASGWKAAIAVAVALGTVAVAGQAGATFPGESGRIVFVRDRRGGPPDLYTIRPDGTGVSRLSGDGRDVSSLNWSADGRRLVFSKFNIYRCSEIFVMNARAGGVQRLTNNQHCDTSPSWSPNGRKIIFASDRRGTRRQVSKREQFDYNIYVMRADGTHITKVGSTPRNDVCPAWSPDGRRIAFTVGWGHASDIYVMRSDGSRLQRLTGAPGPDDCPDWSPDGRRLVFESGRHITDRHRDNYEIYVMDADGSDETRLTTSFESDSGAAWSPDGSRIVFTRQASDQLDYDLYLINLDGTGEGVLTSNRALDYGAAWRPSIRRR